METTKVSFGNVIDWRTAEEEVNYAMERLLANAKGIATTAGDLAYELEAISSPLISLRMLIETIKEQEKAQ